MSSRLLWFFFGGLAATVWMKGKQDSRIKYDRERHTNENWDERRAQLNSIRDRAADSAVEFSEAALDSISTTVEILKQKLAQHRASSSQNNSPTDPKGDL